MTRKIMCRLAVLLPAVAASGLLLTGYAAAQPSSPTVATGHRVQIYEIYYNSPGSDTGSNASLDHEWVRLYNTSSSNISLKNWTLRDAAGHVFVFPSFTLGGHKMVKVRTGHGSNTGTSVYWNRSWYIWNNTGDTATVEDTHGGKVDSCSYNGTSTGYVFC